MGQFYFIALETPEATNSFGQVGICSRYLNTSCNLHSTELDVVTSHGRNLPPDAAIVQNYQIPNSTQINHFQFILNSDIYVL